LPSELAVISSVRRLKVNRWQPEQPLAFASIRNFFDGRAAILAEHPELARAVVIVAERY